MLNIEEIFSCQEEKMIETITLNPSVDLSYYLDLFFINDVNKTANITKTAGGKGLYVSKILRQLGCEVLATGFLGGLNGQFIRNELAKLNIKSSFVSIQDATRNSIAIISSDKYTEIREDGPKVSRVEAEEFVQVFIEQIISHKIQVVAASGSLPQGLEPTYYRALIDQSHQQNVKFILDTSGEPLKEAIKSGPYLIKPNNSELEELIGHKIQSEKELLDVLPQLKCYGINMVVVSLGKEGCIALCGESIFKVTTPDVPVKNPIGSGDAMLAGMAKEIAANSSYEEVLKVGTACGTLNAMEDGKGIIDIKKFQDIYNKIEVEKVR
jgi:tagatose 6-phosphate kinase